VKVVDFESCFEELTGRSEKLERMTGTEEATSQSSDAEVGKEITGFENNGKNGRCASPANSHCMNRKEKGCRGEKHEPHRNDWELFSDSGGVGRKERKDCTPPRARSGMNRKPHGKHVSGAAELACVLLFGHTMTELLESEESSGSGK
jgi:hypothetical protein